MSLRMRLAVAFFVVLIAPVALVMGLVYVAISAAAAPRPPDGVAAVVNGVCQRLRAEADALATQAAVRGEGFAVTDGSVPQPWALCGVGPQSVLLPPGTRYAGLAARAPIPASGGYAYAVVPIDASLLRPVSTAAGCPVELVGTATAPTTGAQPLPLLCAGAAAQPGPPRWLLVPVVATGLLLAVALAWWLAGLATRPLQVLLKAVERIIAGDLTARTAIGGRDEVARLGQGLGVLVGGMREAQRLSLTDPLTGLGNVRRLEQSLRHEVERAGRFGRYLGVLVLDLDHFKQVNDAYGHRAGDSVLVEFVRRMRMSVREVDLAFRQGGEEFVVLLPETDVPGSLTAARRIGEAIRDLPFEIVRPDGEPVLICVTVSIGVAVFPRHAVTGSELLHIADLAMYAAKAAGRDTFALAAPPLPEHPQPRAGSTSIETAAPRASRGR